jgi:uncharacterized protein (TIGR00290 family)
MSSTEPSPSPSTPIPTIHLWSGGKDALLALDVLARSDSYRPAALTTVVVDDAETVRMHGTPVALVRRQADALGLPLTVVRVPRRATNAQYEQALAASLNPLRSDGLRTVVVADIHLEDIRAYREDVLRRIGVDAVFPIWKRAPGRLARRFLDRGYRAVVASVDVTQLDASAAGRRYDRRFLADLPAGVDPCGENGEFHTFVTDGPIFSQSVPVTVDGVETGERMCYARLSAA